MQRYLVIFSLSAVLLVAATALLAWFIDPYGYWNAPVLEGINRYHPASGKHLLAVKLRQYARLQAKTIVAGNSRVEVGIDPAGPNWPRSFQPVYNLGLPGKGTSAVLAAVESAILESEPQRVFVGLDFLDFRIAEADWRNPRPRRATEAPSISDKLVLGAKLLVSLDALTDSFSAIAEQHQQYPATITPQGFNGLSEYNTIVAIEGHAALFEQRNRENLKSYLTGPKQVRWGGGDCPDIRDLKRFTMLAKQRGIAVAYFTYPYHVDLLLSFEKTGLWPAFEQWVRDLAAFADENHVNIYMFTRLDQVTTEPVPDGGDRTTRMRWYWEGGHFKASLGDEMVALMTKPVDKRLLLNGRTAEAQLAELASQLVIYEHRNPEDAARIERAYWQLAH